MAWLLLFAVATVFDRVVLRGLGRVWCLGGSFSVLLFLLGVLPLAASQISDGSPVTPFRSI